MRRLWRVVCLHQQPLRGTPNHHTREPSGEVFDGLAVAAAENDGAVLLHALLREAPGGVPAVLSRVRGPWALVFWEARSGTLWFGRDVLGRRRCVLIGHGRSRPPPDVRAARSLLHHAYRSLLLQRPRDSDARLVLSSVAAPHDGRFDSHWVRPPVPPCSAAWLSATHCFQPVSVAQEELPPGLYSVRPAIGVVSAHGWQAPQLLSLSAYTRAPAPVPVASSACVDALLHALDAAVARRVTNARRAPNTSQSEASVLVLFSGGVDSALLAALAHRHVPLTEPIDLANVCFSAGLSADRRAAHAALIELRALAPERTWRLLEVNAGLDDVAEHRPRLLHLLHPCHTVMDLNIGAALWLAARGSGTCGGAQLTSPARIVLLGTGADEQAAGYSRHRATFVRGGPLALAEELQADVRRLWVRNLGRDDRLVSDCGREARFPFLDEDVMACLAQLPLEAVADLSLPAGEGDKRVLRQAARAVGLPDAARRVKRAIQFGCGVSHAADVHAFGSGRAANAHGGGKCSVLRV